MPASSAWPGSRSSSSTASSARTPCPSRHFAGSTFRRSGWGLETVDANSQGARAQGVSMETTPDFDGLLAALDEAIGSLPLDTCYEPGTKPPPADHHAVLAH